MPQELLQYLNDYLNSLECALQHWQPRNNLSMLEVVERMQLFDWNLGARRYQNFVWECQATTSTGKPEDFVATWSAWCSAVNFIKNVLTGYNEPNFKFLLKEYERKFGNNLHSKLDASITTKGLELEHIFAQRVDTDVQFNLCGSDSSKLASAFSEMVWSLL